eukprot:scaffold49151_cov69-Phaeocystis_antarctica.AAC.3
MVSLAIVSIAIAPCGWAGGEGSSRSLGSGRSLSEARAPVQFSSGLGLFAWLAHEVRLCGGPVTVAPPCAAAAQRDLVRVRVRLRMQVKVSFRVRVRVRAVAAPRHRAVAEALAWLEPELMLEEQLRDARPVQGEAQTLPVRGSSLCGLRRRSIAEDAARDLLAQCVDGLAAEGVVSRLARLHPALRRAAGGVAHWRRG